jgi:hypothetical protein
LNLSFARFVKRHHVSRACLSLGIIAVAVVFFAGGAVLRLFMGPVSLGPLRGPISDALRQAMPGISLQYDQAAVEWSREEGRINLVVLGARMFDSGGRIVAQAPKADIDMAALPLLTGRFVVRRVTLVGVQLALVRLNDGSLRLGVAADKGSDDIIERIREIINRNSSGPSSLQSFAVREARLAIHDEPTGLFLVAPRAALTIRQQGEAIAAAFGAEVEISGRKARVDADIVIPPNDAPMSGQFKVEGLDLRALAANTRKFAALKDVALVTSISSRFGFGAGAKLAFADFDVTAKGEVPLGLYRSPRLHVNALELSGRFDGAARHVRIASATLDAREIKAQISGQAALANGPDGALAQVTGDMALTNLTLAVPGLFAGQAGFTAANFSGGYDLASRRLDVKRLTVSGTGFSMETAGAITFADKLSPGLVLKGTLGQMPVRTFMNYWPLPAAPGAREWVADNIFAGVVGPASFALNMAPGVLGKAALPPEALQVSFALREVEASYMTGLTHATGVAGTAKLMGDDFQVDFTGGRVGNLVVTSGKAVIPALSKHGTIGIFTAHVTGAMTEIMTLIDMKPLGYPTRFRIDPKTTRGDAVVDLDFRVPMLSDVKVDDIGIGIKAAVKGFAVNVGKLRLTEGDVIFDIDNDRLRNAGTVLLADQRFTMDWTEEFGTLDKVTSRINARGLLTPAVREALNINISKVVNGSWPVNAAMTAHRGDLLQVEATLDLTPAVITVPFINQGKAAGESATGRVTVNFTPDGFVSDQVFRITGANVAATGTATFNKGELARLDFSNVRRGLTDIGFTLTKGANGDLYDVRGRALDGSSIGRVASCNLPPGTPRPAPRPDAKAEGLYRVTARLDRLALCDGVSINNVVFDMAANGERLSGLSMSGRIANTAAITANLETVPAGRRITVTAADTGLLARALFTFTGLRGGELRIVANLPGRANDADAPAGTPDFTGNLTMTKFQMVNQAFLARLFSSVSFTGIGDLLQNQGISMDDFTMPFSSKNNVISINNAIFTGGVGGTAEGYIDRPKAMVAIKGSLVPAYGLNSFISNVPLLGDLLASKKGEGILGVTYSMSGPVDKLETSVNPLSMLAPGILRRIFSGAAPNAANAPSNQPVPPVTPPPANAQAQTR